MYKVCKIKYSASVVIDDHFIIIMPVVINPTLGITFELVF